MDTMLILNSIIKKLSNALKGLKKSAMMLIL